MAVAEALRVGSRPVDISAVSLNERGTNKGIGHFSVDRGEIFLEFEVAVSD